MKELNAMAKRDNKVMGLLKVSELSHVIAHTDKGILTLALSKGGSGPDYRYVLDAVPVSDEDNKVLIGLLKDVIVKR